MLAWLTRCFDCCRKKHKAVYQSSENSQDQTEFQQINQHIPNPSTQGLPSESPDQICDLKDGYRPVRPYVLPVSNLIRPNEPVPKSLSSPNDRYNLMMRVHTLRQYVFPRFINKKRPFK